MTDLFDNDGESQEHGSATEATGPGLTPQQARAVNTRGVSVVLSSGAGCGKTEVLTRRYLSHLRVDGAEIGQLVTITFTERAAREMRGRIRRAIRAELTQARDVERERWKRHLQNLETAAISTIHSFCANLLRQYAIPIGLDPRFEVLEELLSSNVRNEALQEASSELLTAPTPAGDDLRALVPVYGWPATVAAVDGLLNAPDIAAWEEWGRRDPAEIAEEWTSRRTEVLPDYVEHLVTAVPGIARCLHLLRTIPCRGPLMQVGVRKLLEETPPLAEAADLAAAVAELCEAAKVGKERAKAWPDDESYEAIKEAFKSFRADLPAKLALFIDEPGDATEAAAVGQRFVRVASACARTYQARKRQAGVVDFQDLLTMARDLVRDDARVREQLRRRFLFVLVDELQDIDPVQMELVRLLCGEGTTHGSLFAVGDAKQSIYRFRGADVELFQKLRRSAPADGRQELSLNFRSQPEIPRFVNALFRRQIPDYEPLTAFRDQVNPGPCVEFLWTGREQKETVRDGRRKEANRLAARLAGMIGGAERLVAQTGETRPVRPRDIVLLFRSMSNVGLYEAALRGRGIDYYLVGGRAFFAQQEIYDLLNLLRALENPQDAVSLAGTLRSPFACLSDEALYLLTRHPDGLWAGLHDDGTLDTLPDEQRGAMDRVRGFLDRWRAQKDRLPIAGLLNLVLAECGYDAALQYEFLGDRKLANLWKLIEMARTFDRSGRFGLADFVARLGDLVRSQPREEQAATLPEEADVVRLMSIHQAKGLEFPVVVLPDLAADAGGRHGDVARWDDLLGCVVKPPIEEGPPLFSDCGWRLWQTREQMADWHEEIRTFYVACTRAEDYLILSAALPSSGKPASPAMTVLASQFRPETGQCLDEGVEPAERPRIRVTDVDDTIADYRLPTQRDPMTPLTLADIEAVRPISVVLDPR